MIRHDLPHTLGPMVGAANAAFILAQEVQVLRTLLADVLLASNAATKGAQVLAVHGQTVVIIGGPEWQTMRRAMIAAGNRLTSQAAPLN